MNTFKVGDMIPDCSLKGQDGQVFEISKFRGEKQIVIIFYPPDGSNGCKNVVCTFHDITEYFGKDDFVIFGICGLPVEYIKGSSRFLELSFPIICDQDNRIKKLFGVPSLKMGKYNMLLTQAFGLNAGRITFVTDREGKAIYKTNSQNGLKCQADEALKICFLMKKFQQRL